jgi:hypothetical protein
MAPLGFPRDRLVSLGLHLSRDPCGGGDDPTLAHGRHALCHRGRDFMRGAAAVEARSLVAAYGGVVALDCDHGLPDAHPRERDALLRRNADALRHRRHHRCNRADLDGGDRRGAEPRGGSGRELGRACARNRRGRNSCRTRARRGDVGSGADALTRCIFVGTRFGARA